MFEGLLASTCIHTQMLKSNWRCQWYIKDVPCPIFKKKKKVKKKKLNCALPLSSPRVCRIIVGAPKANSSYSSSVRSPGALYKCRVHSNPERRCTEMDLGRGQSLHPTASTRNTSYCRLKATQALIHSYRLKMRVRCLFAPPAVSSPFTAPSLCFV